MKYFTIAEMEWSNKAHERGIDNTAPEGVRENLISLIENILDPIRHQWGAPIDVSSGYRCPELNKIVGGRPHSSHTTGLAADLQPRATLNFTKTEMTQNLFVMIRDKMRDLPFERMLLEHNKAKTKWWVHIAFDPSRPLVSGGKTSQDALRIVINDYCSNK